jgi:hypothetical protein
MPMSLDEYIERSQELGRLHAEAFGRDPEIRKLWSLICGSARATCRRLAVDPTDENVAAVLSSTIVHLLERRCPTSKD